MKAASDAAYQLYPSIPARIKAAEIDALITLGFIAVLLGAYLAMGRETPVIILVCVAVLLLYEPVLVSRRGQTIGHKIMGFRIIDSITRTNVSFSKSLWRFVLKSVLGIVSLVGALFERRQQFLHDRIAGSMAVRSDVSAAQIELLDKMYDAPGDTGERRLVMPSLKRRVGFILLYGLGAFILLGVLVDMLFPDCSTEGPTVGEHCYIVESITDGLLVALLVAVIAIGLKGGLPGVRKLIAANSDSGQ